MIDHVFGDALELIEDSSARVDSLREPRSGGGCIAAACVIVLLVVELFPRVTM